MMPAKYWLTNDIPGKEAWKNYCKTKVLNRFNDQMITEFFKNNYYQYVQPMDFSFVRKQLPPILKMATSSRQMQALRYNIKFLCNEMPVLEILKKKQIVEDDTCELCGLSQQTISHIISSCKVTAKTDRSVQLYNQIVQFLSQSCDIPVGDINERLSSEKLKTNTILNPFSTGNIYYLDPKNEELHKIVLLTQKYILNIVDQWKKSKKDVEDKPKGDYGKLLHRNKRQNLKRSDSNSKSKKGFQKNNLYNYFSVVKESQGQNEVVDHQMVQDRLILLVENPCVMPVIAATTDAIQG